MPRKTEPDALKRLEGWLLDSRKRRENPWVRCIEPPSRGCRNWRVELRIDFRTFGGAAPELSDAIHAALDRAGAKS
jgi:hypothetical protein